jgi:hypothetical protein
MRRLVLAAILAASPAFAQTTPPPVVAVIEQPDAAAFKEVLETTIPVRYWPALTAWFNALVKRQADKPKEMPQ